MGGLRKTAVFFMPIGGDWWPLFGLESKKHKSCGEPPLPPGPLCPGVAACLKPWCECHLVYIVILEPVSSNLVFSLG